jgi:uncharacterized protein (DUF305 family)
VTARIAAAALAMALGLGAAAAAQDAHEGHGAHSGHGQTSASTAAFEAANAAMHEGMAIDSTGDADVDFARGMIPHHQGAIDMARIVIAHGADDELKRLAEEIIAAQEVEIAFLEAWLAENGR